jgi:hypothetical protein
MTAPLHKLGDLFLDLDIEGSEISLGDSKERDEAKEDRGEFSGGRDCKIGKPSCETHLHVFERVFLTYAAEDILLAAFLHLAGQ